MVQSKKGLQKKVLVKGVIKMIRSCTIDDAVQLQKIAYQTFDETFRFQNKEENINQYLAENFTHDKVIDELNNPHSFFYFIYDEDKLAGYLKLNIKDAQTETYNDNDLEIERIYILSTFQHKGLGKTLFNQALTLANQLSCDSIWLGVWEKNDNAITFYKNLGFHVIDSHIFYMGDEKQTDYIMMMHI